MDNFLVKLTALADIYGVIITIKALDESKINVEIRSNDHREKEIIEGRFKINMEDNNCEEFFEKLEKACQAYEHDEWYEFKITS